MCKNLIHVVIIHLSVWPFEDQLGSIKSSIQTENADVTEGYIYI